jgi:hypothetical protein
MTLRTAVRKSAPAPGERRSDAAMSSRAARKAAQRISSIGIDSAA